MDHHQNISIAALLYLNEMITAAQCAQLPARAIELLLDDGDIRRAIKPRPGLRGLMVLKPQRYVLLNAVSNLLESSFFQRMEAGARCQHPAADIHPYRVGHNHPIRSQHAADGHPVTFVAVRHDRDPLVGKRQISEVARLRQRSFVNHIDPELDRQSFSKDKPGHENTSLPL